MHERDVRPGEHPPDDGQRLVAVAGAFAWLGLVPLAGAALIFWTVYQLRRGVPA